MQRHNGQLVRVKSAHVEFPEEFMGRHTCHTCGKLVPRGVHRTFCLDHSPYVQKLRKELAKLERQERRQAAAAARKAA